MNSGEELLAPGEQSTGQLCRQGRPLPHRQGQDLAATTTATKCKATTPLPPLRYLGQLESSLLVDFPLVIRVCAPWMLLFVRPDPPCDPFEFYAVLGP